MKLLSTMFFLLGIVLYGIGFYNVFLRENPNQLTFNSYYTVNKQVADAKALPVKISIPAVGITVPILPSKIVNNIPETTTKGASYMTESPVPGTQGNSIIYAHNWENLFGKLPSVKTGEEITVTYANGETKTFTVQYTSVVNPTESEILSPSIDKRITLYTCTGLFDSKRFVAVAVLKG